MRAAAAALFFSLWLFGTAAFAFSFWLVVAAAAFFAFATTAATAALMDVPVSDLFFSRYANFLNRHVEVEVLACERVVAVDCDIVVLDLYDTNRDRALVCVGLKLHADLEVFDALEAIAWHDLLQCWIWLAVAICRIDAHFCSVACDLTSESRFKAWNDVTMTVKIHEWLTGLRLINQSAFVVFKSVVHSDYCAVCDLHIL